MNSTEIKAPKTLHAILPLIAKRWSARSFSDQAISEEDLATILEAASWSASANNEQPWLYYHASKGTVGFEKIYQSLLPGNQPWAKNASVLIAAVARKTIEASGKENPLAFHDVGLANSLLLLQAVSMDIYGHPMGGYDKEILIKNLELTEDQAPVCVIALGYLAEAEKLEEPFKTRELTQRQRKPLEKISVKL